MNFLNAYIMHISQHLSFETCLIIYCSFLGVTMPLSLLTLSDAAPPNVLPHPTVPSLLWLKLTGWRWDQFLQSWCC